MRCCDGVEHLKEETNTGVDVEALLIAVAVDAFTINVFENKIGLAGVSHTRVYKLGNMWISEERKDSALAAEALFASAAEQSDVEKL
jgi:hypothetical protein